MKRDKSGRFVKSKSKKTSIRSGQLNLVRKTRSDKWIRDRLLELGYSKSNINKFLAGKRKKISRTRKK